MVKPDVNLAFSKQRTLKRKRPLETARATWWLQQGTLDERHVMLSRDRLSVVKRARDGWNVCLRGSQGWTTGTHTWMIHLLRKTTVSFGVIGLTATEHKERFAFDDATANDAVPPAAGGVPLGGLVFQDWRQRVRANSFITVALDADRGTVTYGLNGVMNDAPTFQFNTSDKDKVWYPYFAVYGNGCAFNVFPSSEN